MSRPANAQHQASEYVPLSQGRVRDEETALEVDIMILDFLAYDATKGCLKSRGLLNSTEESTPLRLSLTAYEDFLILFKTRYPSYEPDDELRLRILLLQFLALFTQRLALTPSTPSPNDLSVLRKENMQRVQEWIDERKLVPSLPFDDQSFNHELPLDPSYLVVNRANVLRNFSFPPEDTTQAFYGTPSSVALLDLLPLFMRISALRNSMNGGVLNDRWMTLACDYMLQSCLEQYLIFGADGTDAVDEAFSWGYKPPVIDTNDGIHHVQQSAEADQLNNMFEDEDYTTEVQDWTDIRLSYMKKIFNFDDSSNGGHMASSANPTSELISHLQALARRSPMERFEDELLKYLAAVSDSISPPILSQLEQGKLEGMSVEETQPFLRSCGVHISAPSVSHVSSSYL